MRRGLWAGLLAMMLALSLCAGQRAAAAAAVSGTFVEVVLRGSDGDPVAGASVAICPAAADESAAVPLTYDSASGCYRSAVPVALETTYRITALADGYRPLRVTGTIAAGDLLKDASGTAPVLDAAGYGVYRVTLSPVRPDYTVTLAPCAHGTLTVVAIDGVPAVAEADGKYRLQAGQRVQLSATPALNANEYRLHALTVTREGGGSVPVAEDGSFLMPADHVRVSADFRIKTYQLSYSVFLNGTVTADAGTGVSLDALERGREVALTVSPCAGFRLREGSLYVSAATGASVRVDAEGHFAMPASDATIYARFDRAEYAVSYRAAADGAPLLRETVRGGASVSLRAPEQVAGLAAPENKRFRAWRIAGEEYAPSESFTPYASVDVLPVWEPVLCRLRFAAGGGAGVMPPVDVARGTMYTLPAPDFAPPAFRHFAGWLSDGTVYAAATRLAVNGDMTLTALWQDTRCTVSFAANGGSGTMPDAVVAQGEAYVLPDCGFVPPLRQAFDGWSLHGGVCHPGATYTIAADTTLVARWGAPRHGVTVVGGTADVSEAAEGGAVTLTSGLSPPGQVFDHWLVRSGGVAVTGGRFTMGAADVSVEAVWRNAAAGQYTVGFDLSGHGVTAIPTVTRGLRETVPRPPDPTEPGWEFLGWSDGANALFADGTLTVLGNTVCHALWQRATYTIRYTLGGGTLPADAPVSYDVSSDLTLRVPERAGYVFLGWTGSGLNAVTRQVRLRPGSTGDRNYAAVWMPETYTIACDLAGGTANGPTTYTVETPDFALQTPVRPGYRFAGWTGTGVAEPAAVVTVVRGTRGDLSYTAHWTQLRCNVSVASAAHGAVHADSSTAAMGETVALTAVPDTGYRLRAWTVYGSDGTALHVRNGYFTMPGTDVTVRADFESVPPLKVLFSPEGGTLGAGVSACVTAENGVLAALPVATRALWRFDGWYTEQGERVLAPASFDEDTPLFAHWSKLSDSGSALAAQPAAPGLAPLKSALPQLPALGMDFVPPETVEVVVTTDPVTGVVTRAWVETAPDGTVVAIAESSDGSATVRELFPDGTSAETVRDALGSTGYVEMDADGVQTTAEAEISDAAIRRAARNGEPVALLLTLPAADAAGTVPVWIALPEDTAAPVRVEIPAETCHSGIVACLVHDDDSEEILRDCAPGADGMMLTLERSSLIRLVDRTRHFADDIPAWAEDAVRFTAARGIFNGMDGERFCSDVAFSRAMAARVLLNLSGAAVPENTAFADTAGTWYEGAAAWANAAGLLEGGGTFDGGRGISREDFARMLFLYAKLCGCDVSVRADLRGFADARDISGRARDAVAWAVGAGVLTASEDRLDARNGFTRAEAACMMQRFVTRVLNGPAAR